jgi:hypothetical protein
MINHARTLLINATGWQAGEVGEEYVPEAYRAVTLPPSVALVHSFLFGTSPDRLFVNYRAMQLMTLLHATELSDHVLALDKRITYWPNDRQQFFNATFGTQFSQHGGTTLQVSFLGEAAADDRTGRSRDSWRVSFPDEGVAHVQRTKSPRNTFVHEFQTTNGLSDPIPLDGSGLKLRVSAGAAGAEGMIGAALTINSVGRPSLDLGDLDVALSSTVDRGLLDQIFYGQNNDVTRGLVEPFRTFRSLWHDHPLMPYRLGGLLLACIYRTEAIRLHE